MFRAARFGVAAELPDPDGRLRPVSELLEDALAEARGHADELGAPPRSTSFLHWCAAAAAPVASALRTRSAAWGRSCAS